MEKIIAYYCAPALAGIKPSNIISFQKNKFTNIYNAIDKLNAGLNKNDIYFEPLCERNNTILLMVYRKKSLAKILENKENIEFLKSYG